MEQSPEESPAAILQRRNMIRHQLYQRAHPDKVKAFTDKYYQKLKKDQPKYEAMLLLKKEKYQEKKELIEMSKNDVNVE
jgi:NAD-dependent SIR2 family protein deacetylase